MTEKTLTALKGSIKKWEKIVAGTGTDEGWSNCPLCQLFYGEPRNCNGCPVKEKTHLSACVCTPYTKFATARQRKDVSGSRKYAKEELKFLKSLLPRGGK